MASWVADLRLHGLSGLPPDEGSSLVEVRVRSRAVDRPCSTASSFEGVVFLGAWARLALGEEEEQQDVEIKVLYNKHRLPFMRAMRAAAGVLRLRPDSHDPEQGGAWQDVELPLDWHSDVFGQLEEKVAQGVQGGLEALDKAAAQRDAWRHQHAPGAPTSPGTNGGTEHPAVASEVHEERQAEQQKEHNVDKQRSEQEAGPVPGNEEEEKKEARPREAEGAFAAADARGTSRACIGDSDDEGAALPPGAAPRRLMLRLSYRVLPAALAGEAPAAVGVPQCGGEPVEQPTAPLPRKAHCYAHGGFMGLAVSMMADERWRGILSRQDPQYFRKADALFSQLTKKDPRPSRRLSALMTCLENSPVLCAYGLVRSGCTLPVATHTLTPVAEGPEGGSQEASGATELAASPLPSPFQLCRQSVTSGTAPPAVTTTTSSSSETVKAVGLSQEEGAMAAAPPPQSMGHLAAEDELSGVFISRSGRKSRRLAEYRASLGVPNRYGYLPISLEWDLWIHPRRPAQLQHATVDHGTSKQLVTQAVTTSLPCLKPLAKRAGKRQIEEFGVSPVAWMNAFGHSVNEAVNGDEAVPLPLSEGKEEKFYRLHVTVYGVQGGVVARRDLWDAIYVRGLVDSASVAVPVLRTPAGKVSPTGCRWNHDFAFWPLPLTLEKTDLLVEVRGDPAGLVRDQTVGMVRLPLRRLAQAYPELLQGKNLELVFEIGPKRRRHVQQEQAAGRGRRRHDYGAGSGAAGMPPQGEEGEGASAKAGLGTRLEQSGFGQGMQFLGNLADSQLGQGTQALGSRVWGSGVGKAMRTMGSRLGEQASRLLFAPRQLGRAQPLRRSMTGVDELSDEDEEGEGEEGQVVAQAMAGSGGAAGRGAIALRLRLEQVGVLTAAESLGVTPAAAQTCLAMLSKPGGLYLDIKSAYSTPSDIKQFVSTLAGIGVHCKAVCSFQRSQLEVGQLADTVLFFHGISGLENACDDGLCERGQFVLFNGASFLTDLKPVALKAIPAKRAREKLSTSSDYPIDAFAVRKYTGLCETYGIIGGIYVQEPDASPASVSALARLVVENAEYFPLGFAYGHLPGLGVSFLDQRGRGFAAQQLVEEFQARKELSGKVMKRIKQGEHRSATLATTIAWGQRVLYGLGMMTLAEQRTFIVLLAQIWPYKHVRRVVEELGGIPRVFLRFFEQYELTTPLTIFEQGFNLNHSKDLLRLLRNRGVLASYSAREKVDLAKFFTSRQLHGYGLTWIFMRLTVRRSLHKYAKEGLLCLLESCTQQEFLEVVAALGGRPRVESMLRGRLLLSWHYSARLADIERTHQGDPLALAYQNSELKYAALPTSYTRPDSREGGADPCHMRDKTAGEHAWRAVRKGGCCGFTLSYVVALSVASGFTFLCCCMGPRVCGSVSRRYLGISALLSFVLFVIIVVVVVVLVADR